MKTVPWPNGSHTLGMESLEQRALLTVANAVDSYYEAGTECIGEVRAKSTDSQVCQRASTGDACQENSDAQACEGGAVRLETFASKGAAENCSPASTPTSTECDYYDEVHGCWGDTECNEDQTEECIGDLSQCDYEQTEKCEYDTSPTDGESENGIPDETECGYQPPSRESLDNLCDSQQESECEATAAWSRYSRTQEVCSPTEESRTERSSECMVVETCWSDYDSSEWTTRARWRR